MTLADFSAWFDTFTKTAITWLYNSFLDMVQAIFDGVCIAVTTVVSLFPAATSTPSPLLAPASSATLSAFINALNWFFPIGYFVTLVTFAATAVIAYFTIAPLARWFKLLT